MIYRSKLHATLKRNVQVMVQWLELLGKHVLDRHEQMVGYYDRYSSRMRGAEREHSEIEEPDTESTSQVFRPHYRRPRNGPKCSLFAAKREGSSYP